MKSRKNIWFCLGWVVLLAVAASGCKAESWNQDESQAGKKKEDGVVLKIALWGASGEEEALKKAAEGLEEEVEGVSSVVWEQYPSVDEFYDTLPIETAIGKVPDIVILNNEEQGSLIAAGLLEPLDEIPDKSSYVERVLDEWKYEGNLYGLPTSAAPALFIINEDMWAKAGLTKYPKTWDEVYEDAKVLKEKGMTPLCLDIGNVYHVTQYLLSFGGGWNQGSNMDSQENKEAVSYILRMFEEGLAVTAKEEGKSWDGEVFSSGKCAMSTGGTWYIGAMKEAPGIRYKILPMPHTDKGDGKTFHSYGVSVMSNGPNTELAKQAAAYLAREEAQKIRMEVTGDYPSLLSLQDAYEKRYPELSFMKEDLMRAGSFDYPVDFSILDEVQEKLEEKIYGKNPELTPENILKSD